MTRPRPTRLVAATAAAVALALVAAACGGDDTTSPAPSASAGGAVPAQYDLKAAGCPSTIVLQSDWNPESEHGGQYQLLGPNPSFNTGKKSVTSELVAHGGVDTGVKLEIRAGGPAIGFQTVTSQLYADPNITIGYISTDEQIQTSKDHPTVALLAGLEKSPQEIGWSPEKHPDFKTIADIGKTDTKVLYFEGAAYMDYFTGQGILKKSQIDGSYDGTPTNFVASGGEYAVQGFATSEPYTWENEVRSWGKPLKYQLVADAGFDFYQQEIGVRADKLDALKPCLTKLIPIMQQAIVDFIADPATANKVILDAVTKYNNGWVYTQGVADYAVKTMAELGIIGNGKTPTLGDFDDARTQTLIGILSPIYAQQNKPIKDGLKPSDLYTDEFLDTKISLTS
ncbi:MULTISPECIES: nitrate ABC transporter substrate-binding protein [unclassified Pseudofrankia]|uniref:nitrate ABC transporter substrate-binding protein n=1 Tax=unclassified Pseudofrankia TaxID=2994372 RepID=UPI0008DA0713|nr:MULTISPECIES: nitrate ABC transporter substrate-binding protein [unclassified Pseudofrankia]MDT3442397.1 ABC transporter substrate-binding protein [Pseudofrankia sp. BMG5.37]OHV47885.1 nitrate ABC transporter substrate-binding protein [Pseudofrankia sp. BMG5.36]